jgi:hypothetical protein
MKRKYILSLLLIALSTIIVVDNDAAQVQCGCPSEGLNGLVASIDNTFAGCCGEERLLLTLIDDLVADCCQTIAADIALTLSSLPNLSVTCTEFIPDFDICCSTINENFQATFSIIAALGDACEATPITTDTTISAPGTYCLANDIVGDITIASDRVTLDLNGHIVNGLVSIGANALIRVKNGFITTGVSGITINGALSVVLEDIDIYECSGTGITIQNTQVIMINRITIDSCARGIDCTNNPNATLSINECVITNLSNAAASTFGIFCTNCGRVSIFNTYIRNLTGIAQNALGMQFISVGNFFVDNCVIENISTTGAGKAAGITSTNSGQVHVSGCDIKQIATAQGECLGFELVNSSVGLMRQCRVLNLSSTASTGRVQGFHTTTGFGNVFIENHCSNIDGGISTIAAGFAFPITSGNIIDRCTVSGLNNAVGFLVPSNASPTTTAIFNECNVTSITGTTTLFNCYELNDGIGVVNRCTAEDFIGIGFKVSGGIAAGTEWTVARSMATNGDIGFEKPTSVSADPAGMYNVAGLCTTNFSNWPFVDTVGTQIACPGNSGPQIGYNAEG